MRYARELGWATEYLSPDERGEIMSLLLDEVLLEDRGDWWGVQLKGALPCSGESPDGQALEGRVAPSGRSDYRCEGAFQPDRSRRLVSRLDKSFSWRACQGSAANRLELAL